MVKRKWMSGLAMNAINIMALIRRYFLHSRRKAVKFGHTNRICVDQCQLFINIHRNMQELKPGSL